MEEDVEMLVDIFFVLWMVVMEVAGQMVPVVQVKLISEGDRGRNRGVNGSGNGCYLLILTPRPGSIFIPCV